MGYAIEGDCGVQGHLLWGSGSGGSGSGLDMRAKTKNIIFTGLYGPIPRVVGVKGRDCAAGLRNEN